jgi:tRNA (guanosine-2'-O-)-methyltransferase
MKTYSNLTREERIKKVMKQRRSDFCLVLENLQEEQNISAIVRTTEAFGVGLVCIIHQKDKKPKLSKGVSSGASKWLNIEYFTSTKKCFQSLKTKGYQLIGALVNPESEVLWNQDFSGKVAIVVGNEPQGLSKDAQKLVDKNIYLPMFGLTESLNVSVAAGIFLYEVIRNKEKNG